MNSRIDQNGSYFIVYINGLIKGMRRSRMEAEALLNEYAPKPTPVYEQSDHDVCESMGLYSPDNEDCDWL